MNRTHLLSTVTVAAALLGAAGSAFAQEATSDAWMNAQADKSRAQVAVELQQARKDGSIRATAAGYMTPFTPVASRSDVRNDASAALRNGAVTTVNAEAHAFAAPQRGAVAPTTLAAR